MNNILHLKYGVKVERTGAISKAAKNLFMGQPHLSKAIKDLGIAVFNRIAKGVFPTPKGKEVSDLCKKYPGANSGNESFV